MVPALIAPGGSNGLPVVSLDDLLEAFASTKSPCTWRAYEGDLRDFSRYLFPGERASPRAAVDVLTGHGPGQANLLAIGYRKAMEARGLSAATVARRLAALRSVVELAATLGRITWSLRVPSPRIEPFRDVRGPGRDGWRLLVGLGSAECKSIIATKGCRDLAIIRLLHDLLMRRAEVVSLDLEHVEIEHGVPTAVWILGKGRSDRERLELAPPTAIALAGWIGLRGTAAGPLFQPMDGTGRYPSARLTGRSVARIVAAMGRRAGLDRHVAPHGLRHEGITRAIEMGQPLLDVQLAARHRDPRTTQRYIDRVKNPQGRISRLISED